jgi:hypothetical protein
VRQAINLALDRDGTHATVDPPSATNATQL